MRDRRHADGRRHGTRRSATCPVFVRELAERFGISFDAIAGCSQVVVAARDAARASRPIGSSSSAAPPIAWSRPVRCSALWQPLGPAAHRVARRSHTSFGIESKVNLLVQRGAHPHPVARSVRRPGTQRPRYAIAPLRACWSPALAPHHPLATRRRGAPDHVGPSVRSAVEPRRSAPRRDRPSARPRRAPASRRPTSRATIWCSIFMASRTSSTVPFSTRSPSLTRTSRMMPVIGRQAAARQVLALGGREPRHGRQRGGPERTVHDRARRRWR